MPRHPERSGVGAMPRRWISAQGGVHPWRRSTTAAVTLRRATPGRVEIGAPPPGNPLRHSGARNANSS